MTDQFNPGDIVYHKVNNLRMVVLSSNATYATCKYVSAYGNYEESNFQVFELSQHPTQSKDIPVISQLETKKNS